MDTVYKILEDCEVKKVGERQYQFTASTNTQDRDGEVINVDGWDIRNYEKNPVVMYAHDYRSLPIGRSTKVWVSRGKLKNTVEFPPEGTSEFADTVERLVDTGFLKTESVGFIPKKWQDGDGDKGPSRTYTKQELLEISIVPVPSNPDALRNAVDEGVITAKQFKAIKDIVEIVCPYCGSDRVEPKAELGWGFWECCECEKTFDTATKPEESFECECIDCGHKFTTQKHCKDIKCPECGGTCRRAERPGPGQSGITIDTTIPDAIDELAEEAKIELDKPISQEELKDEIDYLKDSIEDVGLSEGAKEAALELAEVIKRLTGGDIPDDIKKEDDGVTLEQVTEIILSTVVNVIEKAQGKV